MKYLLDTHTLIWALEDSVELPQKIRDIIISDNNTIYVSVASLWEIAIKSRKSTNLPITVGELVKYCQRSGYIFLSIGVDPIVELNNLKIKDGMYVNNDPFDRLLVSQSKVNNMLFLTHDSVMKYFDEPCILHY